MALAGSAWLQVALTLVQASLAGQMLTGSATARGLHELVATGAIMWVAALQIVLALVLWRLGRGPAWPIAVTIAVFGLLIMQVGWGYRGRLSLHLPVGVSFLAIELVLAMRLRTADRSTCA